MLRAYYDKMTVGSILISKEPFVIKSIDGDLLKELNHLYNIDNFQGLSLEKIFEINNSEVLNALEIIKNKIETLDSSPYYFNYRHNNHNYLRTIRITPLYSKKECIEEYHLLITTIQDNLFDSKPTDQDNSENKDVSPQGVLVIDQTTNRLKYRNKRIHMMFGLIAPETLLPEPLYASEIYQALNALKYYSLDYHPLKFENPIDYILAQKSESFEFLTKSNDTFRRFQIFKETIIDPDLPNNILVLSFIEKTHDVMAIEESRRDKSKMNVAMKNSKLGLFEWNISTGQVSVSANVLKFFNLDEQYTDKDTLHPAILFSKLHPQDRQNIQDNIFTTISNYDNYSYTFRVNHKDGSIRWLTLTGMKVPLSQALHIIIVGAVSDITEFKHQQDELIKLNEEYINITDFMPHIVWTTDEQGKVVFANRRYNQVIGSNNYGAWTNVIHPDDLIILDDELKNAIEKQRDYYCEFRYFNRLTKSYRWALSRGVRIANPLTGIKWYGTTTDIQDLKDLEDRYLLARNQAESANHAKSAFLANMSHEIRTPLGAIIGYTELLKDFIADKQAHKFINIISKNGQNLTKIIDDILDISKIEAGMMDLENINISPIEEIKNIVDLFRNNAESKGLSLSLHYSTDLDELEILSDPTRFRQILINLIGNAIKFTHDGSIKVLVNGEDMDTLTPTVEIRVKDTGVGIPASASDSIFQEFTQADSSTTRKFGGTGLGLSLSKRLARLLGGDLKYQPNQDLGSCFTFQFTCSRFFGASNQQGHQATHPNKNYNYDVLKGYKILVAEDTEDNQILIKYLLSKHGASVKIVENGQEALKVLQNEEFDIVFLDIQMPILDGYATLEKLQGLNYQGPIVALTAHALKDEKRKSILLGFREHLTKPIKTSELIQCIQTHCPKKLPHKYKI